MKEIVVISGKGGTGKTSLAASFAILGGRNIIVADCDVDAADLHLLLEPDLKESGEFISGEKAVIDPEKCTNCGKCAEICRFDAIKLSSGIHFIDQMNCEGCGYCARICPFEAIRNVHLNAGSWFVSNIRTGSVMIHAKLGIGAENSGKLVALVKNKAKEIAKQQDKKLILIDGSPGIGCPVISSLSGAHAAVLVTEPTISGLHDLKRVYELVKKFRINAGCIINKYDLNPRITNEIIRYLGQEQIAVISMLPYDDSFTSAMTMGKTIIEFENGKIRTMIADSWERILHMININQPI